jgi:hypothetical protein
VFGSSVPHSLEALEDSVVPAGVDEDGEVRTLARWLSRTRSPDGGIEGRSTLFHLSREALLWLERFPELQGAPASISRF